MMNRCKIWMLIFGLLTVQAVQAQDDFIQRADKLYKNQIYDQAADMYLTYLQQTYNYEINLKLAECYRLMHSTVDAEYWYGVIVTQNTADPDIAGLGGHLAGKALCNARARRRSGATWRIERAADHASG